MFLLPNVTTIDLKIPDEKFRETASTMLLCQKG